ncbi:MAG: hypothetical protein ACI8TX_002975 [Hyphomicrobiaceae bacterium]|jgi:hypothetical protein
MTTVSLPLEGGCQCGQLRYSLATAPLTVYACHCTNCQKQTGSAFVLSTAVVESDFAFTAGEPSRFEWISEAGNQRTGYFCGNCGTRIVNGQTPSIGVYSLRAGTFDDTSWVKPAAHIWMRSAQAWFHPNNDDIVWDEQPIDYDPMLERFATFQTFGE